MKDIKRQGLVTSVEQLRKMADGLELQQKRLERKVGMPMFPNMKFQLSIANRENASDIWEFEE